MTLRPSPSQTLAPLLLAVLLGGECGQTHIHPTDHLSISTVLPRFRQDLRKRHRGFWRQGHYQETGIPSRRRRLGLTSRSTLGGPLVLSASVSLTNLVSSH